MKRAIKQRQTYDTRKSELIIATLKSLRKHGYLNSTINTISEESGMSRGLISHYFANKDELLSVAHRYYLQNADDYYRHLVVSTKSGHFAKLLYSSCGSFLRNTGFSPLLIHYMSAASILPDVREMRRELWVRYRANIERRIAAVARERKLTIDTRLTAITLTQLADGLWLGLMMENAYTREECCRIVRKWLCEQFGEDPEAYPLRPDFDVEDFETSAPLPKFTD